MVENNVLFAEAFGTGVLLFALQMVQTKEAAAMAIAISVLMVGPISGGHFNPAITLGFHHLSNAPTADDHQKTKQYIIAQLVGGFVAMIIAILISQDGVDDAGVMQFVPAPLFMDAPVDLNGFSQIRIFLVEWFTTFMFTFAVISICAQSTHNCLNALFVGLSLYFNLTIAAGVSGAYVNPSVVVNMGLKTLIAQFNGVPSPDLNATYFIGVLLGTVLGGVTAPYAYKSLYPPKDNKKKHSDDDEDQNALM
jgi:glycerol uptake facilitator-like aquaporin